MSSPKLIVPLILKNEKTPDKPDHLTYQEAEARIKEAFGNAVTESKPWQVKASLHIGADARSAHTQGKMSNSSNHNMVVFQYSNMPEKCHLLHFGSAHRSLFAANDPPNESSAPPSAPSKIQILEASRNITEWIERLRAFYEPRLVATISGREFHLKDFVIRVGALTIGSSERGAVLEVEYAPAIALECLQGFLWEFIEDNFGSLQVTQPTFRLADLPYDAYSARHTAFQYWSMLYTQRYFV